MTPPFIGLAGSPIAALTAKEGANVPAAAAPTQVPNTDRLVGLVIDSSFPLTRMTGGKRRPERFGLPANRRLAFLLGGARKKV